MKMHVYLRVALIVVLGVVPLLLSCGGGGGGGTSPAPPAPPAPPSAGPAISGTAAIGAGCSHGRIEIGDGDGNKDGGDADDDGKFVIPLINVKTPPYLLRVTTATLPTTTLYSVSADENAAPTINITPLTDLIIRSWYSAQTPSVSIDHAFTDLPNHPAPSPSAVSYIHDLIKNVVQLWLDKNGVTSGDFNLISTPFTAGTITIPATGIDRVLEQAWINATTEPKSIILSDGSTTQNSTLSTFLSSLTASTTTVSVVTGSNVDSGFNDETVVPNSPAIQTALDGINATLTSFRNTIYTRGSSLLYTDLIQYMDASLVHNGYDQTKLAKNFTSDALSNLSKGSPKPYTIDKIYSLGTTSAYVHIKGMGKVTFKPVTGKWLISGNGLSGSVGVALKMVTRQGAITDGNGIHVESIVQAPPGKVTAVTLDGGGIWSSATTTVHDIKVGPYGNLDNYYFDSGVLANVPPKGTPFTVLLTTPTGTESTTILSNVYTTEPSRITNLAGSTLSTVTPGSELTVNWTKPTTFPVAKMNLSYQAWNGMGLACLGNGTVSDPTLPTGKVTIPATCGTGTGSTVARVHVYVGIIGVNEETVQVTYTAQ